MTFLAIDFETAFGFDGYTLSSMTTEAYVRDPRFWAHGAAVSVDREPSYWVTHNDLPRFLGTLDARKTIVHAHHAQFDGAILSHHYGFLAAGYTCSMQMARMLALPGSLAGLAKHFGLPPKGTVLSLSKGLWRLPPHVESIIANYSCHDNWLAIECLDRMKRMLPAAEMPLISHVTQMFVRPLMRINPEPLRARIAEIEAKRLALQVEAGLSRDQLMSNLQLKAFLLREGLDWQGSMAKSNPDFLELQEHPNERIALAVAARLGVKGTMEQSRAQTFIEMGSRGPAMVYLNMGGAGTTRLSGGDKTNYQNLKRGSVLRTANEAPDEDHELIVSDSSQIEARILDTLAGQTDAVEAWHKGVDQYKLIAHDLHPMLALADITKAIRNEGKVIKLASGYGMGAETLQRQLAVGLMGNPPLQVSLEEAERRKNIYRNRHPQVVRLWYKANDWLLWMAEGRDVDWKMLKIRQNRIELPNGLVLRYKHLQQDPDGWTYQTQHGGWSRIWGGTVVQNVCEALARDVVMPQCVHIAKELPWVSSTHDEGVFVVHKSRAAQMTEWCENVMRTVLPDWARGWPIDAEATHGHAYDK